MGSVPGARTGLRARLAGLNHNVLLTGTAKALNGVAGGIWATSTIATYLFMIEDNSNTVRETAWRKLSADLEHCQQRPLRSAPVG